MKNWDVEKICKLLFACGKIALDYYDNPKLELKHDRSIVTEADRKIESILSTEFDKPKENIYLIGEETIANKCNEYIEKALKETAWVVDPIDGTALYAHHIPIWGISIAYMTKGIIREGAIFLPSTGEIFISEGENVYYKSFSHNPSSWNFSNMYEIKNVKNIIDDSSVISVTQEILKPPNALNIPNTVQTLGCAVFSLAYLYLGRYMVYIAGSHLKLWDFAGGLAILKKCNFYTKFINGTEITLDIRDICKLTHTSNSYWEIKHIAVFTPTKQVFNYIINKMETKNV